MRKGLEPSTSGVTGRHSNQLNYRTRLVVFVKRGCKGNYFFSICKTYLNFFFRILSWPEHQMKILTYLDRTEGGAGI